MSVDTSKKQDHGSVYSIIIELDNQMVTLNNKDIKNFYFIEDIMSFCIVGKLVFDDMVGLFEFGPFTGNEKIHLIYGEDSDIIRKFDIYKVNNITQNMGSQITSANTIELLIVDTTFMNLTNKKFSKSWKDTKISSIVSDVATDMLDIEEFEEFEDTNETLDYFYMPYWTPQETLLWLMRRGSSSQLGEAGYLFYNNTKGTNFVTLEKLLQQKKLMSSFGTGISKDNGMYVFESANLYLRNKILSWNISSIDLTGASVLKGSNRLGYNFETKTFINNSYDYSTSISKYTMLGKKTLFTDISDSTTRYVLDGESDSDIIDNIYYSRFIKKYCLQQCVSIVTRGCEGRYAGGMIEINWLSTSGKEKTNLLLKGKYLIKSITHSFTNGTPQYKNKMVLIKNAYSDIHHKTLVKSVKTNISGVRSA